MRLHALAAAGVKWTSLSSVLGATSDFVRTVVLAHFLSPLDYGLMAMAGVVVGFVQMYMDLGISAAVIHRQTYTKNELSSLYWLNIIVGLALFVSMWIVAPWMSFLFREPRVVSLLRVIAISFLIAPIGSQFEILLQKELAFKILARWEIVASLASTMVAISCAVAGFGVWTLVCAFLTPVTVKTLYLAVVGFTRFRPSLHFERADLKGYIGFGMFQMGERSINYLAERLDQLLIGPIMGPQALGYYNFALNLTAQPISRINPILTKVAFPVFSKIQDDPARLRNGYLKVLSLLITVNAPLLLGLAAVAPWAVPVIFGTKWVPAVILVQILSFVSVSRCIGNPIGTLQLAKGRADLGFWWNLFLFICSVPAIYIGGRIGQTTGVAMGLLILHLCINVPEYRLLVRPLLGNCAREYIQVTLRPLGLAAAMGCIVMLAPKLYAGLPVRVELASQILLGGLVYFTLLLALNRRALTDFRAAVLAR
jgi:O-antigen/teichoic acid export membrane protein